MTDAGGCLRADWGPHINPCAALVFAGARADWGPHINPCVTLVFAQVAFSGLARDASGSVWLVLASQWTYFAVSPGCLAAAGHCLLGSPALGPRCPFAAFGQLLLATLAFIVLPRAQLTTTVKAGAMVIAGCPALLITVLAHVCHVTTMLADVQHLGGLGGYLTSSIGLLPEPQLYFSITTLRRMVLQQPNRLSRWAWPQ